MGSPSPLGRPCSPSPPSVWLHRSPYPEFPTPISAAAPHCYSASARRHEWLLSFPPPLSGCPALLPSPPDALLCSSLRPSASPSSLVSALRSTAAAVSPSRSPACSSLCAVFLRASLSARMPISPAHQLSLRTPVCRPELDPCMAPATHDLARIGRQSDDFWTSRS